MYAFALKDVSQSLFWTGRYPKECTTPQETLTNEPHNSRLFWTAQEAAARVDELNMIYKGIAYFNTYPIKEISESN